MSSNKMGWVLPAVVAFTLLAVVLLVPITSAAVTKQSGPTVSAAGRTIGPAQLSSPVPQRMSGLSNNTIVAGFSVGFGELLLCSEDVIRYTIDGSNPTASSPSRPLACDVAVPTSQATYTGTITPDNFTGAGLNAVVTFRLEIKFANQGGASQTHFDENGDLFYKYRLDRTRGAFSEQVPAKVPGSTLGTVAVTSNTKPPVSFTVQDSNAEAALNTSSLLILIDEVDRTSGFDCSTPDPFTWSCQMDYTQLPSNFAFTEGGHPIKALGSDVAGNAFDPLLSTINLRVDLTPPVVRNITATPNQQAGTSGGLPIVSRGGNITVKANVEDLNLNKNFTSSPNTATAVLFNRTNNAIPLSNPFQLKLNETSGKFEGNATVPENWPEQAFGFAVRVIGRDQAGNIGLNNTTADAFILDPILPTIVEQSPPGPFIRDTTTRITARITDVGSGIEPNEVKIFFVNSTGSFKSIPSSAQKTGTAENSFVAKMNRIGATDNFTYDIPAANESTLILYHIVAKDKGGGTAQTVPRALTVDITGPVVTEINPRSFRGPLPYVFEFTIADAGAGVNTTSAKLFYTTGASFTSADLVQNTATGRYSASISPTVSDGQELKYYVEAKDILANVGRNGTQAVPNKSKIDLVAPTISKITSPPTVGTSTFLVEWDGTDSGSGVANFTLEARVNDGTPSIWIPVLNGTTQKSLSFCGEGGHTYEFRVAATDHAGNKGTMPANPQTKTVLEGAGCAEQVITSISSPTAATVVDAALSPTFKVRFTAISTRTFTPTTELRIDVFFSPDGTFWHSVATDVQNTGEYDLAVAELPSCPACKVRIVAKTLTGATGEDTSPGFRVRNGDADADLDGNGLADSWEVLYGDKVGEFSPDGDDDGDGLSNLEESRLGTDPQNRDTDGDGASDRAESRAGTNPLDANDVPTLVQARTDEYTHWYWTVPGLFLATTILFFVGLARRW